ncbi:non-canonical purine NTP pyrophosphatase [Streptomyces sp. NPDC050610]|uniref:non-canonical purine NTP pyrophosphatase n=1 Tax=Streptomyces sp. NPDC050610 TaxID=3157097 RepID=UPI00342BCC07
MLQAVLATANPAKAAEIRALLAGCLDLLPRPAWLPDIVENGTTVEENAYLKAAAVARATGCLAVADDTVMEVDALGGAPGLRSARYAGEGAYDAENMAKVLAEMAGVPASQRGARVRTVALLCRTDGRRVACEGTARGRITERPRGDAGFGYDAVFVPDEGDGRTLGQMTAEEKAALYCRGRAFRALAERLRISAPWPGGAEERLWGSGSGGEGRLVPSGLGGESRVAPYGLGGVSRVAPHRTGDERRIPPYGLGGEVRVSPYGLGVEGRVSPYGIGAEGRVPPYGIGAENRVPPDGTGGERGVAVHGTGGGGRIAAHGTGGGGRIAAHRPGGERRVAPDETGDPDRFAPGETGRAPRNR